MKIDRDRIESFMTKTAEKKGWYLTPDNEQRSYLTEGFIINAERYGYLQCPCRDSWGDREKDRDIICPCEYAAQDIDQWGQCFCGLFLDRKNFEQGGAEGSIPERRPDEKFPD